MILLNSITCLVSIFSYVILEKTFTIPYLLYLTGLSLIEMFVYRPFLLVAKLKGTIEFFMGYKAGEQYTRPKIDTT